MDKSHIHGGNFFIMPDGRVALFDYGITARMQEKQRIAFLRMTMAGAPSTTGGASWRPSATSAPSTRTSTSTS